MDLFTRSRPQDLFPIHVCNVIKSITLQTILSLDTYISIDRHLKSSPPFFFQNSRKRLAQSHINLVLAFIPIRRLGLVVTLDAACSSVFLAAFLVVRVICIAVHSFSIILKFLLFFEAFCMGCPSFAVLIPLHPVNHTDYIPRGLTCPSKTFV